MMGAVDGEARRPSDPVQERAGDDTDNVAGLVTWVRLAVRQGVRHLVGDVLDQGAAERHVQQLLAAADAKHRHFPHQRAGRRG